MDVHTVPSLAVETSTHSLPQIEANVDAKNSTSLYARGSFQCNRTAASFKRHASSIGPGEDRDPPAVESGSLFRADSNELPKSMADREQSWLQSKISLSLKNAFSNRPGGLFQRGDTSAREY